jgi:hypothetical protein
MGHDVSMPLTDNLHGYWIGFQQDAGSAGLYRIRVLDSGMPVGFSLDVVIVRDGFSRELHRVGSEAFEGIG